MPSPSNPRAFPRVAALVALAVVAIAVWFLIGRAQDRPTTTPPVAADVTIPSRAAELSAPLESARTTPISPSSALEAVAPSVSATTANAESSAFRLHGTVLRARGRTALIGEVGVSATDAEGRNRVAMCDADGAYSIDALAPGRYWLRSATPENGRAEVEVDLRGDTLQDLQLSPPRTVRIRVVDEIGVPANVLGVFAAASADAPVEPWKEAANGATNPIGLGHFEFKQVWDNEPDAAVVGRLFVDRDPPLHVSLLLYQHVLTTQHIETLPMTIEFVLRSDDPRTKNGGIVLRAVDADTRLPLGRVTAKLDGGGSRFGGGLEGICEFNDVRSGTYRLELRAKGYGTDQREVVVTPGVITDLGDVPLSGALWIAGRILDETGEGRVLDIRFDPCDASGRVGAMYSGIHAVRSKAEGTFRVDGLASGFCRLEVLSDGDLAACVAVFDVREHPVENATLTVTHGVPFIVDPAGLNAADARFAVLDEAGLRIASRGLSEPSPVRLQLAPGRYTVEFTSARDDPAPRTVPFEIVRDPVTIAMR